MCQWAEAISPSYKHAMVNKVGVGKKVMNKDKESGSIYEDQQNAAKVGW